MRTMLAIAAFAVLFGLFANLNPAPRSYPVTAPEIDECSGLAMSIRNPGLLYVHNDSGGSPTVFVLNPEGGLQHKLSLEGARNRDWEDIAVGPGPETGRSYVFVGEIGDNNARYEHVAIYRFPEPSLIGADSLVIINSFDTLRIEYEDGPRDVEALFVDPRSKDIYLISKREAEVGVYRVAYPQSTTELNTATKIATLPYNWVTAADISPRGDKILVKTYTNAYRYKRGKRQSIAEALSRNPKALAYTIEPQGEAICFDQDGKGRYTLSEKHEGVELQLYYYRK
ncbi:MAG: hypothetical protein V3576_07490 [Candidatus Cloacimonadota bacterium]